MEGKNNGTRRKPNVKQRQQNHRDETKRADTLGRILEWDKQITNKITSFMENKYPNITKTENKLLEISGSEFVWLPACAILYLLHPLVHKQLPVNLIIAIIFDSFVIVILKAIAKRKRPPTKNPDFFKTIGPDNYSFPSGHASRTIVLSFIFTQINPLFSIGYLNCVASILLWCWSFSVCFSRLLNGRHYFVDILIGAVVGFVDSFLISSYIWMSSKQTENILSFLSSGVPEI